MRIAIVSDIHGNRTAFDAILADLRDTAPDLVLHGGDLADSGSSPVDIIDQIRDLGWPGVAGNTDEMLFDPPSLSRFADGQPATLQPLFHTIAEMAGATRERLGSQRLDWLRALPRMHVHGSLILLHASPGELWRAPPADANDAVLQTVFAPLAHHDAVYGHIHRPFIRSVGGRIIANAGSAGLPYDGDPRASYLLLDDDIAATPIVRRVAYDLEQELRSLRQCSLPHSDWVAHMLQTALPQLP